MYGRGEEEKDILEGFNKKIEVNDGKEVKRKELKGMIWNERNLGLWNERIMIKIKRGKM